MNSLIEEARVSVTRVYFAIELRANIKIVQDRHRPNIKQV